jgi:hypothetical protein
VCRGQTADWIPFDSPKTLTINADNTVTDSRTGLIWQRELPAAYPGCSGNTCTWQQAVAYCASIGWRLPTKAELESIVDYGRAAAFDPLYFPNTPVDFFWTSSTYLPSAGNAWYINFSGGNTYATSYAYNFHVRCVR